MSVYRMTKAERIEFEKRAAEVRSKAGASGENRDFLVANLLAFLGIIHDTPAAKRDWVGWSRR